MNKKNLSLDLNMESLREMVPVLRKALPSIVGIALVGLFAYTAFVLNSLINVQPASSQSTLTPLPKIVFSQSVLKSLPNRTSVNGNVNVSLGANQDPF